MRLRIGRRISRSLDKNADEMLAFLRGRMPAFVTGLGDAEPREIPAFTFHDVGPERFERQLDFLHVNGYRTVTADELAAGGPADRRVALTFDDARASFWTCAFPLLKRHGCRAILFAVPGVVPDAAPPRPTLEGERVERHAPETGPPPDGSETFCAWPEIVRMHESGLVDVQSHSMHHARVPVSPRVVDFVHPGLRGGPGDFEIPVPAVAEPGSGADGRRLGAPVFESAPRLGGRRRFLEDSRFVEELVSLVESEGRERFFRQSGWRRSLRRIVDARPPAERGTFESERDLRAAIRREVVDARRCLEERLPAASVRHLAYPWYAGSALSDRIAAEAGCRSVLYGSLLDESQPDASPTRVRRVPERYLMRLPGRGRVSLATALGSSRRGFGP